MLLRLGGLALLVLSVVACADPCENTTVEEFPSPDGEAKLVVFGRECGATTGFSTQASIMPWWGKVTGIGNVFVADSDHGAAPTDKVGRVELHVRWLSNNVVELTHHAKARISKAERNVKGIAIQYATSGPG